MLLFFGKRLLGCAEVAAVASAYVKVRVEHGWGLGNGHGAPGSTDTRITAVGEAGLILLSAKHLRGVEISEFHSFFSSVKHESLIASHLQGKGITANV